METCGAADFGARCCRHEVARQKRTLTGHIPPKRIFATLIQPANLVGAEIAEIAGISSGELAVGISAICAIPAAWV